VDLVEIVADIRTRPRTIIGIAGYPGAGKTTLARALTVALGARAVHVPMDGFHLADIELSRLGILTRKGAPETFDAAGYAALLGRIRTDTAHTIYAPAFDRTIEQPLAGSIPVFPEHEIVVTEGNYLLLDEAEWRDVRERIDEVWFVVGDEAERVDRLIRRHVEFGKTLDQAREWVARVDEANAGLIAAAVERADRVIDATRWDAESSRDAPSSWDAS
jgi:pantothenate kinase